MKIFAVWDSELQLSVDSDNPPKPPSAKDVYSLVYLCTEVDPLLAELESARADKKMLDWLSKQPEFSRWGSSLIVGHETVGLVGADSGDVPLRELIRVAMEHAEAVEAARRAAVTVGASHEETTL